MHWDIAGTGAASIDGKCFVNATQAARVKSAENRTLDGRISPPTAVRTHTPVYLLMTRKPALGSTRYSCQEGHFRVARKRHMPKATNRTTFSKELPIDFRRSRVETECSTPAKTSRSETEWTMLLNVLRVPFSSPGYLAAGFLLATVAFAADEPASKEALWKKLEPFAQPPAEFAGKFGSYRSPLKFADGSIAK